jgi:CheY-like chemotaxis protein
MSKGPRHALEADEPLAVILIEDDQAIAEMYRARLEFDGYVVAVASDGVAGLEMTRELQPDLVFLDIRLPKMDGFAVLEALRSDDETKDIPVVILSNYSERELIERGLKLGALEYLIKADVTPSKVAQKVPGWSSTRPE